MDLIAQYSDDDDDVKPPTENAPPLALGAAPKAAARKPIAGVDAAQLPQINAAPDVSIIGFDTVKNFAINSADKKMLTNPSFEAMNKPLVGPVEVGSCGLQQKFNNHKLGQVDKAHISQFTFDQQYHTFHNFGYADNPDRYAEAGREILESTQATPEHGRSIWDKATKRRRMNDEDLAEEHQEGADKWGGFADEATVRKVLESEVKEREEEVQRQKEEEQAVEGEERETKERITSVFHGARETDYSGRSWMASKAQPPKDVDERHCFLPKKWIHTWSGHTMGVQQMRWFPKTAHMLLSCSMDATIKIWDYHNQRKCLRTYMGHDQAVRDINFNNDGTRFYSVSYDKNVQYWDTETGQIITTFTNKKTPYCVSVHPVENNIICCGCSNKKAVQWDANTATIVQEYDEHLGAVNTVTFCENGKRLITTADDKKIFVWEYGIPVVVKHIADPSMHSVPAMVKSADDRYVLGQAMDNKLICYEGFGRFKFCIKKQFKGHLCAGYAISPGWSSDGKWVMSGDADGKVWFWDWQKMKNYRVLKAHDGVCSSCMWHPASTSRVVTCGWDGAIKLWD